MPSYFNVKAVMDGKMPGLRHRAAFIDTPITRSPSSEVIIPESKFNQTFEDLTRNAITDIHGGKQMGERNKILRGVKGKNETFATLQIVRAGAPAAAIEFSNFILQSAQEVSQEKYQLVETFGETVAFFFGDRPKVYQYAGVLTNTDDYPWRDKYKDYYERALRGTRLVENKQRAYLTYDYVLREGYMLSFTLSQTSAIPNSLEFNFTMFITKEVNLSPSDIDDNINIAESTEAAKRSERDAAISAGKQVNGAKIKNIADAAAHWLSEFLGKKSFQPGTAISDLGADEYDNAARSNPDLQINVNMEKA